MWKKSDTKSGLRHGSARKKGREDPIVDEDVGNVTLSGPLEAEIEALKRAVDFDPTMVGSNRGHVIATS